ncbi:MAG: DNA polymerase III subunit chi [Pseudomonadota bacterium]
MTQIGFYHLTSTTLESALPTLLLKSLERRWRVVVQAADRDRLAELDTHLWTHSQAGFLPHGSSVGSDGHPDPNSERQPVWLTTEDDNPNRATVRFFVAGAFPDHETDFQAYERLVLMFNGQEQQEVEAARTCWRALKSSDGELIYWKQTPSGTWEKAGDT